MEPDIEKPRRGKTVSLPLPPGLHDEVRAIANSEGNPITAVIRCLTREAIQHRKAVQLRQAVTQ